MDLYFLHNEIDIDVTRVSNWGGILHVLPVCNGHDNGKSRYFQVVFQPFCSNNRMEEAVARWCFEMEPNNEWNIKYSEEEDKEDEEEMRRICHGVDVRMYLEKCITTPSPLISS